MRYAGGHIAIRFSPVAILVHLKVIAEMLAQPGGYPPPFLQPRTFGPTTEQAEHGDVGAWHI